VTLSRPYEQLREGDVFAAGDRAVTDEDIRVFAGLTGDMHPQHVDDAWAEAGMFGERTAHGMLVLSYAVGMMTSHSEQMLAIRRVADIVFTRPVAIGDTIKIRGRVMSMTVLTTDTGVVGISVRIVNQLERTVCRARFELLWRRVAGSHMVSAN
jgi:acyl dehydratase